MQSFLQYRRFGKILEAQLERSGEKVTKLRQQRKNGLQKSILTSRNLALSQEKDLEAGPIEEDEADHKFQNNHLITSPPSQSLEERPVAEHDIEQAAIPDIESDELQIIPTQSTTGTTLGHALTGIQVRERTTREGGPELGKVFVVSFENAQDPMNPQNWSFLKRTTATMTLSLIGGIVGFASAVDSAVIPQAMAEFGVSQVAESLATGIFLIGFGAGALIAGPFSETVGRNPIYILTMALYMVFLVGAGAAPNISAQLACRFFAGIFGATPLVCAGGSLSDLWTPAERVFAFPMFACFSFLGPLIGPVVGGWVGESNTLSWRWTEWITLIASGVILSIVVLIQPETYHPILLKWKAEHLRRLTGDKRYRGGIEIRKTPLATRLVRAIYRPVLMFIREPIIILFGLYLSTIYIVLFTFLTGYTFIFTDIYGLSQGMTGVCFVGQMIGVLSCGAFIPLNAHLRKRDIARARVLGPDVKVAPESRLYWAMLGAPAIPISLFWMGWTARPDISIWSPLLASVLFGFGILCVFMTAYQYVIDAYEVYAASALASITLIRYIIAGAFIEISIPFYRNMGWHIH
ncbi:MFS transporter [Talaromyces proteolyticus]|uniref:MFS transporter n=1 Tax=Talaromyces proteolyticus TaxID=1131652 RepID=A0AAD4PRR2_9EURO|nr:MFS transporter [Talaromyces proteolyticus]KAH8689519.1 MFS transporter [Talaromyces proteolyticus]